jgi:hypothetical protein
VKYIFSIACVVVIAVMVITTAGCHSSDNNPAQTGGPWTLSGRTFFAGLPDPVGGVTVTCAGVTTTSAADGSYEIRGVPEGTQTLTAQKIDCAPYSRSIDVRSELTYHIYLNKSSTNIAGNVIDGLGDVVQGAKVVLRSYTDYTDELGRFQFSNIPRQSVDTVVVSHPDYSPGQFVCSSNTGEVHLTCKLAKEWVVYGGITLDTYVDETLPGNVFYFSNQLLLGTAGSDSLGRWRYSHRNILLSFTFPEILRNDSVTVVEASLQLYAEAAYAAFAYQTFAVTRTWNYNVNYISQPTIGSLLSSGTIGDGSGPKYWPVLGTDGLKQLVALWKTGAPLYGVEVQGGPVSGKGFSSNEAARNRPVLSFRIRY